LRVLTLLLLALSVGPIGGHPSALAASFRLVDGNGVVHLTNAPTDVRYQRQPQSSGTVSGWLALRESTPGRYAADIQAASERHGVDGKLVEVVISVESAFNPRAVSRKGAQGLMQLMPKTAAQLGIQNPFSPRENIEAGVHHLRQLMERYGGNLPLALAAYNAGAHAVDWYRGIPPYPETRQYVQRVLKLYRFGSEAAAPQSIYRYEDEAGTVTYTNIPPVVIRRSPR